ncbi:hypothetical protein D3C72_1472620 [compost metagenome]
MRSTMWLRFGPSSAWRHFSRLTTLAREKSDALRWRVFTMPQRTFVPPMSTARMASCPFSRGGGVRCAQPISPPSSTLCDSRPSCTCTPRSSSIAPASRIARSPTSLSGKPPPTTMRCTLRHEGWRTKRWTTKASSSANSSMAPCITSPAAVAVFPCSARSSCFLLRSREWAAPSGSRPVLRRRLRQRSSSSRNAVWLAWSPTKPSLSRSCRL